MKSRYNDYNKLLYLDEIKIIKLSLDFFKCIFIGIQNNTCIVFYMNGIACNKHSLGKSKSLKSNP